ncbi:MAG: nucleotidyltransferase domain-containing protein [Thermoprotei archaeon]|nr:nucleotidyltransferase domain-containing protein [Thermoprotei archaeon]
MWRKGLENLDEPYRSVLGKLLSLLLEVFGENLVSLVVFGSVARGDYRRDSDIDLLLVVKNLPKGRFRRVELFEKAEEKLKKDLNALFDKGYYISFSPIIKTPEEASKISPLYLDMVEDAVIVYDRNGFFEKILLRLKRKLEELGAERVWMGKKWYWRLKRNFRFGEVITIE